MIISTQQRLSIQSCTHKDIGFYYHKLKGTYFIGNSIMKHKFPSEKGIIDLSQPFMKAEYSAQQT